MGRDESGWAILIAVLLVLFVGGGGFLFMAMRNERARADEAARVAEMEAAAARVAAQGKAGDK